MRKVRDARVDTFRFCRTCQFDLGTLDLLD
jgi:hypothetical protein